MRLCFLDTPQSTPLKSHQHGCVNKDGTNGCAGVEGGSSGGFNPRQEPRAPNECSEREKLSSPGKSILTDYPTPNGQS